MSYGQGCQRSYFSETMLKMLGCTLSDGISVEYDTSTYLGSQRKTLMEMVIEIEMGPGVSRFVTVLLYSSLDISFGIGHFTQVIEDLKKG